jgi:hypothetical protein
MASSASCAGARHVVPGPNAGRDHGAFGHEATIVSLTSKLDHAEQRAEADKSTPAVPQPLELTPRGSMASAATSTTESLG